MASSAWERRNARARAAGFESYYDYRAHNYGQSSERLRGDDLARLRGHRSRADLERAIEREPRQVIVTPDDRDPRTGQYKSFTVAVVDENGNVRFYTLRGRQAGDLESLYQLLVDAGIPPVIGYGLSLVEQE